MWELLTIEIPWDPNIVTIGGVVLTWHGLFTAVGILVGVQAALRIARVIGLDEDELYTLALVAVPAGIVGARGLFVIENWDFFGDNVSEIIALNEGGISVWGSLVTGVLGATAWSIWRHYDVRAQLDVAAFGMILGLGIGRIGDLINGEHLAKESDFPWSVIYTDPHSPAFAHSIATGPHHPATTYELLVAGIIFSTLFPLFFRWLWRYPGTTFAVTAALYAMTRFLLTYLRLDSAEVLFGLRVPQVMAILILLTVVPLGIYWFRQGGSDEKFHRRLSPRTSNAEVER